MSEAQDIVLQKLAGLIGEKQTGDQGMQLRITDLERQIDNLTAKLTTEPKPQSPEKGNDAWPPKKQSGGDDIASLVSAAVQEAVKPLAQEVGNIRAGREVDSRKQAHQQSFNLAVKQFPDLADPSSDLSRATEELFKSRPELAQLPDAPMVLSSIAKGVLADARTSQQKLTETKKSAAVSTPTATGNLDVASLSEDRDRATQARELKDKLIEKSQQEGSGIEDFADMFRLNLEQIRAGDSEQE